MRKPGTRGLSQGRGRNCGPGSVRIEKMSKVSFFGHYRLIMSSHCMENNRTGMVMCKFGEKSETTKLPYLIFPSLTYSGPQ
jgi:hypothetical protein